ncbi:DNA-binding protein [Streptomyces sp. NPDC001480]|uniref:DNA-binding protein n=1 Tax=Streptomyces sp. NPDC001480 TaxID=3364577 RepID=UPI0036C04577
MGAEGLAGEIRSRLSLLVAGAVSRGELADWAMSAMESDAPELRDDRIWMALDRLSGVDLMVAPGQYLHGREDFDVWVADYCAEAGGVTDAGYR